MLVSTALWRYTSVSRSLSLMRFFRAHEDNQSTAQALEPTIHLIARQLKQLSGAGEALRCCTVNQSTAQAVEPTIHLLVRQLKQLSGAGEAPRCCTVLQ